MIDQHAGANRPERNGSDVNPPGCLYSDTIGRGRLMAMVNEKKVKFGKRLLGLMQASGIDDKELAAFLGLTTTKQIENYLKGDQGPTFDGLMELHVLFGIPLGEVAGTQEWETPIDRDAVRARLKYLT